MTVGYLICAILIEGMKEQLMQARDILELGLRNVSYAREAVALSDGKSIADVSWAKVRKVLRSLVVYGICFVKRFGICCGRLQRNT